MQKLLFLAVGALLVAPSHPAKADWFYDFNDEQLPSSWEFGPPDRWPSNTWSVDASGGFLAITESRSFDQGGTPVVRGRDTSEMFSNVRVAGTVNLDPSLGTFLGVTANSNEEGAYGFGIEIAPSSDQGTAWLSRVGGGIVQWGSQRDFGIPTRLDVDKSYYLVLDVVGDQLTGRVFDVPGGVELISMSQTVSNPIVAPGYAGVFTDSAIGFDDVPTAGTFDNVSAVAIPEPTGAALIVVGMANAVCFGARFRRSCRSS